MSVPVTGAPPSAAKPQLPLYRRHLGEAWDTLPAAIRAMHDGTGTWTADGRAQVERGRGLLARMTEVLFRFPKEGSDVPVSVHFESVDGREIWTRDFAGRRFASVQCEGRGHLLCETFGPFTFAMTLMPDGNALRLIQRHWSVFGIPLPLALGPRGNTYESDDDGRFNFHVEIGLSWTGLIVRYRGWLVRR